MVNFRKVKHIKADLEIIFSNLIFIVMPVRTAITEKKTAFF